MTDWISRRDHALLLPKPAPGQGIGPETPAPLGGPDGSVTMKFRAMRLFNLDKFNLRLLRETPGGTGELQKAPQE